MHKQISFTVDPFNYNVSYFVEIHQTKPDQRISNNCSQSAQTITNDDESQGEQTITNDDEYQGEQIKNETIFIEAIHLPSYLVWSTIMSDSQLCCVQSKKKLMDDLTPEIVFKIFSEYIDVGNSNKYVRIKFPSQIKSQKDDIPIEIIFIARAFGGNEIEDCRMIILSVKETSYKDRIDKRIDKIYDVIETKESESEKKIYERIETQCATLDKKLRQTEIEMLQRIMSIETEFDAKIDQLILNMAQRLGTVQKTIESKLSQNMFDMTQLSKNTELISKKLIETNNIENLLIFNNIEIKLTEVEVKLNEVEIKVGALIIESVQKLSENTELISKKLIEENNIENLQIFKKIELKLNELDERINALTPDVNQNGYIDKHEDENENVEFQ